ncbi:MAG: type II toxin-antitoxin system Phd/YefM family antitoxin [Chthoniobacterales bacterium]
MSTITYTEARENLATIWDKTVTSREPVVISRRGTESVVMLPLEEWEGVTETAHLLRSPANARRLLSALLRAEKGEGKAMTRADLAEEVGIS